MQSWTQITRWAWESADGYRIAAARDGDGFLYAAFAPSFGSYNEYAATLKARYRRGERIPEFREHLGWFDDAESAREACREHAARKAA